MFSFCFYTTRKIIFLKRSKSDDAKIVVGNLSVIKTFSSFMFEFLCVQISRAVSHRNDACLLYNAKQMYLSTLR